MKRLACMVLCFLVHSIGVARIWTALPGENLDALVEKLGPGDTLQFTDGIYRDTLYLNGLRGEAGRPIVIRGEKGTIFRPRARDGVVCWGGGGSEHVVLEELTICGASRAGIIGTGMHDITIRNCTIVSNGVWGIQTCLSSDVQVEYCLIAHSQEQHGIYFSSTDRPTARGNVIYGNAACGIHLNGDQSEGGDGLVEGAMIVGNRIYGNGRSGGAAINMDGVARSTVVNNLIYGNESGGITSFHQNGRETGSYNVFQRNTVYFRRGRGRFGLQIVGASQGNTIEGNILVCGRGPALEVELQSIQGLREKRNVLWVYGRREVVNTGPLQTWRGLSGQGIATVEVDPMFEDPGTGDFKFSTRSRVRGYGVGARLAGHE